MNTTIKINRTVLLALQNFASTDEARYVINGVCIEVSKSGKVMAIATDGKRLGVFNEGEAIEKPEKLSRFVIPLNVAMLKALPRSRSGIPSNVHIAFAGNRATFSPDGSTNDASFSVELIDDDYPKWRQVVPAGELSGPVDPCFNYRLLESFYKAALTVHKDASSGITIRGDGKSGPLLILSHALPTFFGVLMTMRYDTQAKAPDWATATPEE